MTVDDVELRGLVPRVLSVLVRRGADFATAEDAVQEALIRAVAAWDTEMPADPKAWLITVGWRAFLDMTRSEAAARQGKFWEMHDSLFGDQGHLDVPHLWERAERFGLDMDRFEADPRSDAVEQRVAADFRTGIRAGVATTPMAVS